METCPNCNHLQLRKDAKFCVFCGTTLGSTCHHCHTKHSYGKQVCGISGCNSIISSVFAAPHGDNVEDFYINSTKIAAVWQRLITDFNTYTQHLTDLTEDTGDTDNTVDTQQPTQYAEDTEDTTDNTDNTTENFTTEPTTRGENTDPTYTDDVLSVNSEDEEEAGDVFSVDSSKLLTQRQYITNEILTTERDYINDLDYIIEVFLHGLKDSKCIGPGEITTIFSNIENIRDVNFLLFRYLQNADDCPSVPQAFMLTADKMKIYGTYCGNLEKSLDLIIQLTKSKPLFGAFLTNCKNRKDSRSLDINSWLIKPLQRLCKYPLLLNQLKQATSPTDPEYDVLSTAYQKMEDIVTIVNSYKKDVESKKKAAELSQKLEGADALHLMDPGRYFIQEGPVLLHPKDKGHYHLFSDLLILSKKKKVEDSIALDWCCIRPKVIGSLSVLEISHLGVRTWNFHFENDAEKIMFLKKVTEFTDKAMDKAYKRYREAVADDSDPPMDFATWRSERENIPCGKSPVTKRSTSRLSGLFKMGNG